MSHTPSRLRLILYPTVNPFLISDDQERPIEPEQHPGRLPPYLLPGRSYLLVTRDRRAYPILPEQRENSARIQPQPVGEQIRLEQAPPLAPVERPPPPPAQDILALAWQDAGLADWNAQDDDDDPLPPQPNAEPIGGQALLDDVFDDALQAPLLPRHPAPALGVQCQWLRRPALDAQDVDLLMMMGPGLTDPADADQLLLHSPLEISFEHELEPRPFPRRPTLHDKLRLCSRVRLEGLTQDAVAEFLGEGWLNRTIHTLRLVIVYPTGTELGPDSVEAFQWLLETARTWPRLINFHLVMRVESFDAPDVLNVLLPTLETCTLDIAYARPAPRHRIRIDDPALLERMALFGFCSPNRTAELCLDTLERTLGLLTPDQRTVLCLQLDCHYQSSWINTTPFIKQCLLRQLVVDQLPDGQTMTHCKGFSARFPSLVILTLVCRRAWGRDKASLFHLGALTRLVELRLEMASEHGWLDPDSILNLSARSAAWAQVRVLTISPDLPDGAWARMQPEADRIVFGLMAARYLSGMQILVVRMPAFVFAQCPGCRGQPIIPEEAPDRRCGTHRFDFARFRTNCTRLRRIYVLADNRIRYQWTGPRPGVETGTN